MPEFKPNRAPSDHPIHDLLAQRSSPRAFSERPLSPEQVQLLLEAARWAPSSSNEQPWEIYYGTLEHPEGLAKLQSLLFEGNYWAKKAPFLALMVSRKRFGQSPFAPAGEINRHSMYDTGAAAMAMALQSTAMGLHSHQMGGYDVEKAREVLHLGPDEEPAAMIAIGYPGESTHLRPDHLEQEGGPRSRRAAAAFSHHVR